jgi:hypothetical protein
VIFWQNCKKYCILFSPKTCLSEKEGKYDKRGSPQPAISIFTGLSGSIGGLDMKHTGKYIPAGAYGGNFKSWICLIILLFAGTVFLSGQ